MSSNYASPRVKSGSKYPLAVFDAPSTLGLSTTQDGMIPGCSKLPWALRNLDLVARLGARDEGCAIPPPYIVASNEQPRGVNVTGLARYSLQLAGRLRDVLGRYDRALVLGGDCGILVGNLLGLSGMARHGLVFVDAHSDFRHSGNSQRVGSAAGEDLAIVTGRGDERLTDLEGRRPYVRECDVCAIGVRDDDEYLEEVRRVPIRVITSGEIARVGAHQAAITAAEIASRSTEGFWVHFDADAVDATEMSAVDSPAPDGPSFSVVTEILATLWSSPMCRGAEVTIYDPDRDPSGSQAAALARCLVAAFQATGPLPEAPDIPDVTSTVHPPRNSSRCVNEQGGRR